jgi:UDP-N-acetylmuramoyl-tripeptide--D-alanyl-D-alanine ligase
MITLTLSEIAQALEAKRLGEDTGFTDCSIDTRTLKSGSLYIALQGERFDGHDFVNAAQEKGAAALLVSQNITSDLPTLQVADTRIALGKLAHFWRQRFELPIVAITGSNGKTTTKEMLRAIFTQQSAGDTSQVLATEGNLNNEIGVPLTLFNLKATHRYAVIEMGANHPGEIAQLTDIAEPTCATITQCAPAHLEGFKTVKGVALAKSEIFSHLKTTNSRAVINNDDTYAQLWQDIARAYPISTFGLDKPADVTAQGIQLNQSSSDFTLMTPEGSVPIHLPLSGKHNILNALAASACALASGCVLDTIQAGLQNMQAVKGRLQHYAGIKNSTLIDDTYNANPTSLKAALEVLQQSPSPRWLILGDMKELGNQEIEFHQQAGEQAREMGIEYLYGIGELSRNAVIGFGKGAQHFSQHEDLIETLKRNLPSEATLLIKGSRSMQMEKVVKGLL